MLARRQRTISAVAAVAFLEYSPDKAEGCGSPHAPLLLLFPLLLDLAILSPPLHGLAVPLSWDFRRRS